MDKEPARKQGRFTPVLGIDAPARTILYRETYNKLYRARIKADPERLAAHRARNVRNTLNWRKRMQAAKRGEIREVVGDIWEYYDADNWIAITTNGFVKGDGCAVMGRGVARQAAERFPRLPKQLGSKLRACGNVLIAFPDYRIFTFPVKHVWWEAADLRLIVSSMKQLRLAAARYRTDVYMPRPGCGNGKLEWSDVRPAILSEMSEHIVIVEYKPV